jgi:hypothetical protein
VTTTPLAHWPSTAGPPPAAGQLLSYDANAQALSCIGVLSKADYDRWAFRSADPQFRDALRTLAVASHEAPIMDDYGYNRPTDPSSSFIVRDLMLEFDVEPGDANGRVAAELDDGRHRYRAEFDLVRRTVALFQDDNPQAIEWGSLPGEQSASAMHCEMSLMDRQVLVAVDNETLIGPVRYADAGENRPIPRRPARIGASGGPLAITSLRVYRDVYYTPKGQNRETLPLAGDEFFVLGDNSPVSVDSRCWDDPAVRRRELVGRPFAVHLPSQQASLVLWGRQHYVRIPDFSRVRYIR